MARPLNRAQTLENTAFLRALRRTANVRQAAKETGVAYSTLQHRRARHPGFAQRWDAALVMARARLHTRKASDRLTPDPSRKREGSLRTVGGEEVVVQRADGTLQVRRAQPGKLTKACEQAFLAALSATCNVTLSAAAAGASPRAFYRRKAMHPGFAREMRLALKEGYRRLEEAMLESVDPVGHADDAWRNNEPPPMPQMTAGQMLQLMYLHQKEARLWARRPHFRTRAHETRDAYSERVAAQWRLDKDRELEEWRVTLAAKLSRMTAKHEPPAPALPALDQVTGWSRADPAKAPHHEGRALFGGWRIGDLTEEQKALAKRRREGR